VSRRVQWETGDDDLMTTEKWKVNKTEQQTTQIWTDTPSLCVRLWSCHGYKTKSMNWREKKIHMTPVKKVSVLLMSINQIRRTKVYKSGIHGIWVQEKPVLWANKRTNNQNSSQILATLLPLFSRTLFPWNFSDVQDNLRFLPIKSNLTLFKNTPNEY